MDDFDEKLNKIVWRRSIPEKKRKKLLFKKNWFIGLFFLVLLIWLIGSFVFAPIFKVKKIDISGTTGATAALMKSFIHSYIINKGSVAVGRENILFFDSKELAKKIKEEFPKVEEARIKKDFLRRTILVELTEKKPIGIWCIDPNLCFYLEKGGSIFEEAPQAEGSLIFIVKTRGISETPKLGSKVIEENFLNFMLKIKEDLFSLTNVGAKEFLLKAANFDVEVVTTEGFKIFFDSKKNPDSQIANLKIMLEDKIREERANLEYIDLREGNRIYYKLKNVE